MEGQGASGYRSDTQEARPRQALVARMPCPLNKDSWISEYDIRGIAAQPVTIAEDRHKPQCIERPSGKRIER
eukprot:1863950-Amphidinium_carterae.1